MDPGERGCSFFGVNLMNATNVVKTIRTTPRQQAQIKSNAGTDSPVPQSLTLYELSQDYRPWRN